MAETVLTDLPRGAEKNGELWELRGLVHELKEQWQDAARCFRQAVSLEPWRRKAQSHLVNVLRRQDDTTGAEVHAERAKELFEIEERLATATHWMATTNMHPAAGSSFEIGDLYEKRGQAEEARAWYVEALRLDPKNEAARIGLSRLGRPMERR